MDFFRDISDNLTVVLSKPRHTVNQIAYVFRAAAVALVGWRLLGYICGNDSPFVVVLSGSMEPLTYRGDILFTYTPKNYDIGDIVVYKLPGKMIPIVHRIVNIHTTETGALKYLTKGDNNYSDDRSLYSYNAQWLEHEQLMGVVKAVIPYFGMPTIWINEKQGFKPLIIGIMMLSSFLGKD